MGGRGLAAFLASLPASSAEQPTRSVAGSTGISPRDPSVEVTPLRSAHYVGTDRFVLSDPDLGKFDACELFAFVEADRSRHIRAFDWIQLSGWFTSPTPPGARN